jgi:hypothetical protein
MAAKYGPKIIMTMENMVLFWIAANTYLQDKPKPKVLSGDTIT